VRIVETRAAADAAKAAEAANAKPAE
jgi:hypothetical protein